MEHDNHFADDIPKSRAHRIVQRADFDAGKQLLAKFKKNKSLAGNFGPTVISGNSEQSGPWKS